MKSTTGLALDILDLLRTHSIDTHISCVLWAKVIRRKPEHLHEKFGKGSNATNQWSRFKRRLRKYKVPHQEIVDRSLPINDFGRKTILFSLQTKEWIKNTLPSLKVFPVESNKEVEKLFSGLQKN